MHGTNLLFLPIETSYCYLQTGYIRVSNTQYHQYFSYLIIFELLIATEYHGIVGYKVLILNNLFPQHFQEPGRIQSIHLILYLRKMGT